MKAFTHLYLQIDRTTKTNARIEAMSEYFAKAPAADSIWAVALLTHRPPRRPVRTNDLRRWAAELADIPAWLFEECYAVAGDLAETISLLVPAKKTESDVPLHSVMNEILRMYEAPEDEKKAWLLSYWNNLTRDEIFVFNKLITGSFRIGVSQQLVYKSLSKTFDMDEKQVAHQLMGHWWPAESTLQQLLQDIDHTLDDSRPYPFYLAYQLDVPLEELGNISDWQIERKYDGIRGQLIVRNNEVYIWSRGEDLMTEKFPEFSALKNKLPHGTVLDGEILPYKEGKILSFGEMQKRIGRKNLSPKILKEVPLCMMCYDLLEWRGEDWRQKPLSERGSQLEALLHGFPDPILQISPSLECGNWEELDGHRMHSKSLGCEGLMLKHKDSVYETGRRRGKWWKWKVDPYTVDAVLIYAQAGSGRRANLFTDYTFAVWDKDILVPFTKAYSGLTDQEIVEVDRWIKKNTLEKFGPVRSVKAELVFEIAFEGLQSSSRHKSGVALRFPRISRWRKDKRIEEINTKNDLLQLLKAQ